MSNSAFKKSTITTPVSVANGGTGKATVTSNSYLKGNGTGNLVERTYTEVRTDLNVADGLTWSLITADPSPAVKDNGYLCNTTGGAFTVTLPAAPDEGDIVAVADAAGTFDTLNLTLGRNSLKIMGLEQDMTVSTKYIAFSLVYASAALGWRIG